MASQHDAHVWTWWHHHNPEPGLKWVRSRCPRCGAATVKQAARKCRPFRMPSGDYECPRDDEEAPIYFGYLHDRSAVWSKWNGDFWEEVAIREGLTQRNIDQLPGRTG